MLHKWGAVDGDGNADAIIADRRAERRAINIGAIANFFVLAGCATWYAMTKSPAALAIEIVVAAWLVVRGVQREIYQTHTMLMIAERRVQLIEQKLQDLSADLTRR